MVFDEYIGTVALLGVFVVDEGIIEGIDMSRGLPDLGVHKDGGVNTHDIGGKECHGLPPVAFDVVLEFATELPIVIDCAETIIDLGGGEDEAVFLTVSDYLFEEVLLLCHYC